MNPIDDYNASFRDTLWLQSFPLNEQTVLHYFSLSQFYDRECNNEKIKIQRLHLDRLKTMRGIEYEILPIALNNSENNMIPLKNLFRIRKQMRQTPSQVNPLAIYYILDGTIYQAPDFHTLLSSRMKKCSYHMNQALKQLSNGVKFVPTRGYSWDFASKDDEIDSTVILENSSKRRDEKEDINNQESVRTDTILLDLAKKYQTKKAEIAMCKQGE